MFNIQTYSGKLILTFLFLFSFIFSIAQDTILIHGQITNNNQSPLNHVMVINQRTFTGSYARVDGKFTERALKTDTIIISSTGYQTQKISFQDSADKKEFTITIALGSLQYKLKEINIYALKSLEDIDKDIAEIGVKSTDTYKDVNALSSPITYLYERFSRFEQSKRKVAELENEDRRRAVLKDLFRVYIKYDVIYLTDAEFDNFIEYCNFSDAFIKNSTQYELISTVKQRFERYELLRKK